jgi:hypothetical protein
MKRTLLSSCALVSVVACGGYGYEARTTTITGAPMITSGPALGEQELPRTLRSSSERLALAVCQHESYCGRTDKHCVDATVQQARQELSSWRCEPAAVRARFEECLVGFQSQSCDLNLRTDKQPYCAANAACTDDNARLIAPGPELAKIWQ